MHLASADLCALVQEAAVAQQRRLRLVAVGGQAGDHPVHPAIPETSYLKALTFIAD